MYGWAGTVLRVDLTKKKIVKDPLKPDFAKMWLGGRGFNSKILYDEFDVGVLNPYSPQNIVCISHGVLVGTACPACRNTTVSVGRSPVTGLFSDSSMGGVWGPELRFAGYDTRVLYGKSDTPTYLSVMDEDVTLEDASDLWGKDTWETDQILREHDENIQVLSIGPSGENMVAYSTCCHRHGMDRVATKSGCGAVMGSKKLKAIAVKGTHKVELAEPNKFNTLSQEIRDKIWNADTIQGIKEYGTRSLTKPFYGMLPIKDYQVTQIDGVEQLFAENIRRNYPIVSSKPCFNCNMIRCSNYVETPTGEAVPVTQYQPIVHMGTNCGLVDFDAILKLVNLCNRYGLDAVNGGGLIALLMHYWQDGILTKEDTDGLEVEWGSATTMEALINKIVYRKGIGDVLADGAFPAAKWIAKKKGIALNQLTKYIVHIKKCFVPAAELRPAKGIALSYATATRGGDHLRGITKLEAGLAKLEVPEDFMAHGYPREIAEKCIELKCTVLARYEGKGYAVKFIEDGFGAFASAGICLFVTFYNLANFGVENLAALTSFATGESYTWQDLVKCGERLTNIEKALQVRMGVRKADDMMPERYFVEEIPDGWAKGAVIDRAKYMKMLEEYYEFRGWNSEGVPTARKLNELGLQNVVKDLNP